MNRWSAELRFGVMVDAGLAGSETDVPGLVTGSARYGSIQRAPAPMHHRCL